MPLQIRWVRFRTMELLCFPGFSHPRYFCPISTIGNVQITTSKMEYWLKQRNLTKINAYKTHFRIKFNNS